MAKEDRIKIIRKIERRLNSNVICYLTGDRPGPLTTKIADDAVKLFKYHLERFSNRKKRLDLFLYSRGGDMITPLRLVRLIRENCSSFNVIIPHRAHSAATLISLGANNIIMHQLGELTPVDPTTMHPFNPEDPNNPKKKMAISVEDLTSYFLLAKEKADVQNDQMVNVFSELKNVLHPLSLGNVYRGYRMVRLLTEKLLKLHMKTSKRVTKILKNLNEYLCIHNYPIAREEAKKDIGLDVIYPDPILERYIWSLFKEYESEMKLSEPFNPQLMIQDNQPTDFSYNGAFIESKNRTDAFEFKGTISPVAGPSGQISSANVNITSSVWKELD
ncbi:hypothetical protein OAA99_02160 [Omnitrophica bacterium]|nr:hypothetical protein [Candidatus Omnitrophota bacterium]